MINDIRMYIFYVIIMQIDDDVSLFIIIVMKEGDWVIFPTFKKNKLCFKCI